MPLKYLTAFQLIIVLLSMSCNNKTSSVENKGNTDSTSLSEADTSLSEESMSEMLKDPFLKDFYRMNPNIISDYKNIENAEFLSPDSINSDSESDGDMFAKIYEDFLRKRNSGEKYDTQFQQIRSIYKVINELFAITRYGTAYGHDALRLGAKAQFFIYKNNSIFSMNSDTSGLWKLKRDKINKIKSTINMDLNDLVLTQKELKSRKKLLEAQYKLLDKYIFENWHIKALESITSNPLYW